MKKKSPNKDSMAVRGVEQIAEALIAHVTEAQNHLVDPFEEYVFGVEAKIFSKEKDFPQRCVKGYKALQEVVEE